MARIVVLSFGMAEPRETGEKTVVISEVPTSIHGDTDHRRHPGAGGLPLRQRHSGAAAGRGVVGGGAGAARPRVVAGDAALAGLGDCCDRHCLGASASRHGRCPTKSPPSAGACRVIVREVRTAIQSASPRQSLLRQLQQAVTELEQTTTAAKPTDATPVTIVETDRRAAADVELRTDCWPRTSATVILLLFLIYFLLASGEMFKRSS